MSCFILHFNFGIRSGGGIGDVTGIRPYTGTTWFWLKWMNDMVFYVTVILLVLNMLNGIIISQFSQIREDEEKNNYDIKNVCFICSKSREDFESKKKSFNEHITKEHVKENYVYYLVGILLIKETELDSEQSYIVNCLNKNEISFFPVEKTTYLENDEAESENSDIESENSDTESENSDTKSENSDTNSENEKGSEKKGDDKNSMSRESEEINKNDDEKNSKLIYY
jgi:hypothetical protein